VGVYTSQQLRDAFAAHGCVEDVILRTAKKKSKGSALVVMATRAGAAAAAAAAHGDPANPLLVVPFLKVRICRAQEAEDRKEKASGSIMNVLIGYAARQTRQPAAGNSLQSSLF